METAETIPPNETALPALAATTEPFLKWAGGKRQLLPELRKYLPTAIDRYIEPFVGGGALFFDLAGRKQIKRLALLGDANAELVSCYGAVRDSVEEIIAILKDMPYDRELYYQVRAATTLAMPVTSAVARAVRMIYLNKCGFNGLYRVNRAGRFNVPFGKYVNPTVCDAERLRACSRALASSNVGMWTGDFDHGFEIPPGETTVIYCDPPYWPVSKTANFTAYQKGGFGPSEQARLRDAALGWARRGAHVILSNADVAEIRSLYVGFEIHAVKATRRINSKGESRGDVGEVILVKPT